MMYMSIRICHYVDVMFNVRRHISFLEKLFSSSDENQASALNDVNGSSGYRIALLGVIISCYIAPKLIVLNSFLFAFVFKCESCSTCP